MATTDKWIQGFRENPWEPDITLMLITPGRGVIFIKGIHEKGTMLWKKYQFFEKALRISSLSASEIFPTKVLHNIKYYVSQSSGNISNYYLSF